MVRKLIPLFQNMVQKVANHLLALDPEVQKEFSQFRNKVIKIEIVDLEKIVFLRFAETGIELLDNYAGEVQTSVKGTLLSLSQLGSNKSLSIEGDVEFMQQLMQLSKKYQFDLGALLANAFGDVAGHQLENGLRGALKWVQGSSQKMGKDMSEFLTDEIRVLPTRDEITIFSNEVDVLRDDVERISVKINRLLGES